MIRFLLLVFLSGKSSTPLFYSFYLMIAIILLFIYCYFDFESLPIPDLKKASKNSNGKIYFFAHHTFSLFLLVFFSSFSPLFLPFFPHRLKRSTICFEIIPPPLERGVGRGWNTELQTYNPD